MSSTEQVSDAPTPSPIMQMATSFWVSKTLMTAVELDVFTKISSYQKDKNVESITLEEFQDLTGIRDNRPAIGRPSNCSGIIFSRKVISVLVVVLVWWIPANWIRQRK